MPSLHADSFFYIILTAHLHSTIMSYIGRMAAQDQALGIAVRAWWVRPRWDWMKSPTHRSGFPESRNLSTDSRKYDAPIRPQEPLGPNDLNLGNLSTVLRRTPQGKAQSPQKTSPIRERWLSILKWLPPPTTTILDFARHLKRHLRHAQKISTFVNAQH